MNVVLISKSYDDLVLLVAKIRECLGIFMYMCILSSMQGDRIQVLFKSHMHFFCDTIYLYGQDHLIEQHKRDQLQSNLALISM